MTGMTINVSAVDETIASEFAALSKNSYAQRVRDGFGLAVSRGPLFAVLSRLVHQKGIDLVIQAAETIVREGGQIAVMGQGEKSIEDELRNLAGRYPGQIGVKIGYDDASAQRIFFGSDFFLMPARFEPCGLTQMYAQKVGSLLVAHSTGGLADTVEDGVTGFLFRTPSLSGLLNAVYRAVDTFASGRELNHMRRAAMRRRFGWHAPARQYEAIYERAIALRPLKLSVFWLSSVAC
ncbi:MAG: glycosyltransferase [Xanthobacteraceae bacterium]|nr:glycosyltransferase [Xanthobacteraceae bacterium]